MTIDFMPSLAVALSLGACALLPASLLMLSHRPLKVARPGRRFLAAAAMTWAAWAAAMVAIEPELVDLLTGGLLLATSTLAGFTLWTLVAWGFTLSMLLALHRAGQPLSLEDWALAYTRGKPLDAFTRDRLSVLLKLGLAQFRNGEATMTLGRGRALAGIAAVLRRVFGLPT